MARPKKHPEGSPEAAYQRELILSAFSEIARRSGIRAVVMAELASELRMSATTLYQQFKSKDEIVMELVKRWADDVAKWESATPPGTGSAADGLLYWSDAWSGAVARYAPAFWDDLKRDHPKAYSIFRERLGEWKRLGAARLRPFIREGLNPDMALATLNLILENAPKPEISESLGISRKEAIETAIAIWARGALVSPGKIRALKPPAKEPGTGPDERGR